MERKKTPPQFLKNKNNFGNKKKKDEELDDEQDEKEPDEIEDDDANDDDGATDQFEAKSGPSIGKDFELRTTVHPKANGFGGTSESGKPSRRIDQFHEKAKSGQAHPCVGKFCSTAKQITHANFQTPEHRGEILHMIMNRWLGGSNGQ